MKVSNYLTDIPVWILFHLIKVRNVLVHCGAGLADEAAVYDRLRFKRVYWIECNPNFFETIRAELGKYNNQDLICAALGDLADESVELNLASNGYSSSFLAPVKHLDIFPEVSFKDKIQLVTCRFDDLNLECSGNDLLILDVQGFEKKVLRGAKNSLRNFQFVYSEFQVENLYQNGSTLNDLKQELGEDFKLLIKAGIRHRGLWKCIIHEKSFFC